MKKTIQLHLLFLLINVSINSSPLTEGIDPIQLNQIRTQFLEEIRTNKLLTHQEISSLEKQIQEIQESLQKQQKEFTKNQDCLKLFDSFISLQEQDITSFIKNHAECIDFFIMIKMQTEYQAKQQQKEYEYQQKLQKEYERLKRKKENEPPLKKWLQQLGNRQTRNS